MFNILNDILGQIDDNSSNISSSSENWGFNHEKENNNKVYDPFECSIDESLESEFDSFNNDKKIGPKLSVKVICNDCQVPMLINENYYECSQCGKLDELINFNSGLEGVETFNSYNTSDNSSAPIRIAGPDSHIFQNKLISNTSNYRKAQKKNTENQFDQTIYQYQGPKPPKHIVQEAAELYNKIQQHCIKRGDVRKGTMAACLYRICDINNITRKPKEIANIFGISQSEFSNGEKILDDLKSQGLITFKEINNPEENRMHSFLNMYFESLKIPIDDEEIEIDPDLKEAKILRPNYKSFACKLIKITEKYKISHSSIMSSKCAGVIYVISTKCKELKIKKEHIENTCKISRSTFGRFHKEIMNILKSESHPAKPELETLFKMLD